MCGRDDLEARTDSLAQPGELNSQERSVFRGSARRICMRRRLRAERGRNPVPALGRPPRRRHPRVGRDRLSSRRL